jgi:HD-GYP domain-containing protein (c-di-GMP phosphodiesterase class II)
VRRVNVRFLEEGMIIGRPILNADGRVLLNKDTVLTTSYIKRLDQLGFGSVYIKDPLSNIEIQDIVSPKTKVFVANAVKDTIRSLVSKGKFELKAIHKSISLLVDELLTNRNVLLNLEDIRAYDDYLLGHSINVSILSIMLAINLGYDELKLQEIGIGSLLHDIGKTQIDDSILNKPGPLTPEEFKIVQEHSAIGFNILRNNPEISLLSAHIAFQHHERWDGTGYPRKLSSNEISQNARITAVADVFDALISDRQYRPGYPINQALAIIKMNSGKHFEQRMVDILFANVASFPVGSIVVLNTGEIAVVLETKKVAPKNPIIKIIFDKEHNQLKNPHEVDLSTMSHILIVEALSEPEIAKLKSKLQNF